MSKDFSKLEAQFDDAMMNFRSHKAT